MAVLIFALLALGLVGPAYAQVHVDVGIHLPRPPQLVVVPEVRSVQYVPSGDANLFFHGGRYWAFTNGDWHSSRKHSGPWVVVGRSAVPQSVLLIPVNYYRARPASWNKWQAQNPPRWGNQWGHEWAQQRNWKDRDDDHDRGRGNDGRGNDGRRNDRHDNRRDGKGGGR